MAKNSNLATSQVTTIVSPNERLNSFLAAIADSHRPASPSLGGPKPMASDENHGFIRGDPYLPSRITMIFDVSNFTVHNNRVKVKRSLILKIVPLFLVSIIAIIFLAVFNKPSQAQASELFTLYFDIDYVRQESAQIFAELFLTKESPDLIEKQEKIGELPSLLKPEVLTNKLKANREKVNEVLLSINEKSFSDTAVRKAHSEVRDYYTFLAAFEVKVISELENVKSEIDMGNVITTVFESEEYLPLLIKKDNMLRNSLVQLAEKYSYNFEPKSYDNMYSERLADLSEPITLNEYGEALYPFSVKETTVIQAVVSVSSAIPFDKNTKFSFVHPDGRRIAIPFVTPKESVLFEKDNKSYGDKCGETCAVFKLFPQDANVYPIAGNWQFVVLTKIGNNLVFGFTEF